MKGFLFLPLFLILFSGCDFTSQAKGCSSDSDCRAGRQCIENACVGETTNFNNASNNTATFNNDGDCETLCNNDNFSDTPDIGALSCDCSYYSNNFTNNSSNNYTNNTSNKYTNNYSNNGTNNYSNNSTNNYTNNGTIVACEIADDCGVDDVCTKPNCGVDPNSEECVSGICAAAEPATLVEESFRRSGCNFVWNVGQEDVRFICFERNERNYGCTCLIDGQRPKNISFGENPCSNGREIEELVNTFCGTKIRGTFEP